MQVLAYKAAPKYGDTWRASVSHPVRWQGGEQSIKTGWERGKPAQAAM